MTQKTNPRPRLASAILALAALAGGYGLAVAADTRTGAPSADLVARGRYLATVAGCSDCHTPLKLGPDGPEPDSSRLLAGHPEELVMPPPEPAPGPWAWAGAGTNTAFAGPWGVSYASNLTPDDNTGIGIWTEEIFVNTLRSGRHWGVARPILPPMPWPNYARMTDEDLKAVYAYLRTVPPVHNLVPDSVPAPPPDGAAESE